MERVSATPDDAPAWLAVVREDLVAHDPEEFREVWGID